MAAVEVLTEFFCFMCYKDKEERYECYEQHVLLRTKREQPSDTFYSCVECKAEVKEVISVTAFFDSFRESIFKCTGCDFDVENKDSLQFHAECGCTTRRISR
ncbi:hypothetical protein CDAR_621941 [Caerostris darwini]|uniref:Uncharacterized protein n=1 Tax=Caerostris darwini TaxID=1538125 RepID=A0AAV4P5M7_9ARAC|nr:hypothetical protein CDAR_621941 [Caerostris darwini]